ncbi:uncharacterized protein LOC130649343 [Hydractinia symbiolongicarpus]|uniref:uncharacterized protein LOC130649343 n=1 Tax=Hydractinia symbiolongicarpus TaxID=13093 RepID=UPI00254D7525|nr:uncharacterized protein LOC130649343 [Hydractinia symbiolongicarpus]
MAGEDVKNIIELDDDFFVTEEMLSDFTVYESCEVEVSFVEDLLEEENEVDAGYLGIPQIVFVDEEDVDMVVDNNSTKNVKFVCSKCKKQYFKEAYYKKHTLICKKPTDPETTTVARKTLDDSKNKSTTTISTKQVKSKSNQSLSITDHELQQEKMNFVRDAMVKISKDPINNIVVKGFKTPGNRVKELANSILNAGSDVLDIISENVVCRIFKELQKSNLLTGSGKESLWRKVHELAQDDKFRQHWKHVLPKGYCIDSQEFSMLLQKFVMELIKILVAHENKNRHVEKSLDLKLTTEEQTVLYYVSGYIIFSLRKKYQRLADSKNKVVAVAALQFLNSLKVSGDDKLQVYSFLDYTRSWVDQVSRGYLIKVNDDMFIFCRRIKNVIRKVLNLNMLKKYKGEDIRELFENELMKDSLIDQAWVILSRYLGNEKLSKILKAQIIKKWCDIRAKAYVTAYIQVVRRKLASLASEKKEKLTVVLSKKGEPAMRKKLN